MAMPSLDPNFYDLLKCFDNHGVRYLLIGGYAVIHHGYDRLTKDMDLWIDSDPQNAERVSKALIEFGYRPEHVPASHFERQGMMFRIGRPPNLVELYTQPNGVEFEKSWRNRVQTQLGAISVPVISLADLRQSKLAAGRLKDLADLEELPPSP